MFVCAQPGCQRPGVVFVQIPGQVPSRAPLGRLFCADHAMSPEWEDSTTKPDFD